MSAHVIQGDCVRLMGVWMPPNSIDAIVTDPPYGLEFMGREWDKLGGPHWRTDRAPDKTGRGSWFGDNHDSPRYGGKPRDQQAWHERWAIEAYRVMKPGGHVLAFGGTRTYHRLACALEDAGFEIRDCLSWLYWSGFPKSHDISKAIDREAGAVREVMGYKPNLPGLHRSRSTANHFTDDDWQGSDDAARAITEPATAEAAEWAGWGTALKPAWEPIILARKPIMRNTVAQNVQAFGTGALNIDGCRIEGEYKWRASDSDSVGGGMFPNGSSGDGPNAAGRWPANLVLDPEAAAMLDAQSGVSTSPNKVTRGGNRNQAFGMSRQDGVDCYGDTGGASRFFYVPKASREERNAGLDGMPEVESRGNYGDGIQDNRPHTKPGYEYRATVRNHHPTVKPVDLMRWLIRLITPPGGIVLDPFNGSGSTGCAAAAEGVAYIGLELDAEYCEISRRRIAWWEREAAIERQQLRMFAAEDVPTVAAENKPQALSLF
jgi:DNA modification methylase